MVVLQTASRGTVASSYTGNSNRNIDHYITACNRGRRFGEGGGGVSFILIFNEANLQIYVSVFFPGSVGPRMCTNNLS